MLVLILLVNLSLCQAFTDKNEESSDGSDFGEELISTLRNDANLDLSVDEEYEDLRAELLAYHTALASLTSQSRRSMMSTPCWELGGICVEYKLCTGFRFLSEVPGCKNRLNVCCFAWNRFKVSDWRHEGISNLDMPWSIHQEVGGLGIVDISQKKKNHKRKHKKNKKILNSNATDFKIPDLETSELRETMDNSKQSVESSTPPAVVFLFKSYK